VVHGKSRKYGVLQLKPSYHEVIPVMGVVVKPVAYIANIKWKKGWDKPITIDSSEFIEAVRRVRRERTSFEKALLVELRIEDSFAKGCLIYWNPNWNDVEIALLYPLLFCKIIKEVI